MIVRGLSLGFASSLVALLAGCPRRDPPPAAPAPALYGNAYGYGYGYGNPGYAGYGYPAYGTPAAGYGAPQSSPPQAPAPASAPPAFPPPAAPLPAPAPVSSSSDPFARARQVCLAHTNDLRARVGARPLVYAAQANSCSDDAARNDGRTRTAHGAFGRCRESAQNECPGWPGSADDITSPCLDMMFGEGPGDFSGHGHYLNMTNRSYSSVACGFAVAPDGKMWMVQNFF